MKKNLTLIVLVLVVALALSACGCKHETWNEANCENPKTCADCGETEGAPLGHSWLAATCETAKTCEVCDKTEGEVPGHTWVEADCENAKTCSTCGKVEGEALGHAWLDATTETPKTCETCGLTEGERIITDERFTTAATIDYQGKWVTEFNMSGEMMNLTDFGKGIDCYLYLELCNDGAAVLRIEAKDVAALEADMTNYLIDALYKELAASGLNKDAADAAFVETYGMSLQEYAGYAVKEMDLAAVFEQMRVEMVYYIEDGNLYMGESWISDMSVPSPVTLEGDTMILEEDMSALGIEEDKMVFTRVVE
jgi:hypothetical protein